MRDTIIMQKTLLALLFTLYFTGCAERGQNLEPAPVHATVSKNTPMVPVKPVAKPIINVEKSKLKSVAPTSTTLKQENKKLKPEEERTKVIAPVKISQTINTNIDDGFFNLSDETKNNISGFFILVIGIIILL